MEQGASKIGHTPLPFRRVVLARTWASDHIERMATQSSESALRPAKPRTSQVLGRSAATGGYILKPKSKTGSISLRQASAAVKSVLSKKK